MSISNLPRSFAFRGDRGHVFVVKGKTDYRIVALQNFHKVALMCRYSFSTFEAAYAAAHRVKHTFVWANDYVVMDDRYVDAFVIARDEGRATLVK